MTIHCLIQPPDFSINKYASGRYEREDVKYSLTTLLLSVVGCS